MEPDLSLLASDIKAIVKMNDETYEECLNLNAAHSAMSPAVRTLLCSELEFRGGLVTRKIYHGVYKYYEKIYLIATELAKKLFKAKFAECRLLTGSIANCVALYSLTNLKDKIMALPTKYPQRAHFTCRDSGFGGYRGLEITDIPLEEDKLDIDVDAMAKVASRAKPKLIILGSPALLFPYPLREIREIADDVGSRIMYDGAHVMGLIACGKFQDPLREGADMLVGST